jgi:hypothetical protein
MSRLRYEILEETNSWLRFRFDLGGGRTQQVSVRHIPEVDGAAWIEISSPVGWADAIDLRQFLELAGVSVIGGAAVVDGVALLKHTAPLEELSVLAEFERPLTLIVAWADAIERELTQTDQF